VLQAALTVLAENGLPGFTMEAIAHQAGAGKSTVYRHWAKPSALLIAAMDAQFEPLQNTATGDVRTDLVNLFTQASALLSDGRFPRLMAAFIDAAEREPELAALHTEITNRRRQPVLQLLRDAVGRGQVRDDTDLELAVDLLTGPFFYRRFIAHRPIPAHMAEAVVDHVLASLAPPSAARTP
jgi:AcrR family transcriptional regulator